jgi:GR25 family glycosyltransferase involved in LPS biosynthesis
MQGIDRVYVLHCRQGYADREKSIREQFARHGIEFEFILEWDKSDITVEQKKQFTPGYLDTLMSISLKHIEAMKQTVKHRYERCLVFEDDIILFENFSAKVEELLEESKNITEPHCIYLSNSCNKYTPRSRLLKNRHLYDHDHSRAADAYVMTLEACQKRLEWLEHNQIALPLDHLFTQIDRALGIKMFWAEPPICEQGSMSGLFASSVENRYTLLMRKIRWQLDKFYKMHILRNLR